MGGDGGGGDGGASANIQAEEARKTALRARINQLYGIATPGGGATAPTREQFTTGGRAATWVPSGDTGYETPAVEGTLDQAAYDKAMADFNAQGGADGVANSAAAQMAKEEQDLADSTRNFYSEDLKHTYDRAKRRNTFALADRGLLGGSAQVDTEGELNRDNTLGATRLEDEVRGAVAGLKSARESERLNAAALVNSGAGEEAIAGAQAGLSRALQNATSTRKASIASDLFANGADAVAAGMNQGVGPAALAQYRNSLKTFYGSGGGSAGRVTAT